MEEHDSKKRDTQHRDRTLRIATLSLVTLSIMTINTVDTVVLSVVNKLIMLSVVNKANNAKCSAIKYFIVPLGAPFGLAPALPRNSKLELK
jgi:hypothetical protein